MSQPLRQLIEQLASPMESMRKQAREHLVEAGRAAVPDLVQALASQERDIRAGAALCLGRIGFSNAAGVLAAMSEQDPDPTVRPLALRALVDLTGPDSPARVRELLTRQLAQGEVFARALACRGLGRIGAPADRALLHQALSDEDDWVREAAKLALAAGDEADPSPSATQFGDAAGASSALVPLDTKRAVQQQVAQLASPDLEQQHAAQQGLLELGPQVVGPVADRLDNPLFPGRRAAIEVLGQIGSSEAAQRLARTLEATTAAGEPLLAPLLHGLASCIRRGAELAPGPLNRARRLLAGSPDGLVRAAAARLLLLAGGAMADDAARTALQNDDPWVSATAAAALAQQGDESPALRSAVHSRLRQLQQLGDEHDDEIRDLLVTLTRWNSADPDSRRDAAASASYFLQHDRPAVRHAAAGLLVRCAAPEDVDLPAMTGLAEQLEEATTELRTRWLAALPRLARPETTPLVVDAMVQVLRNIPPQPPTPPPDARAAAAGLVQIGDKQAITALTELANSRAGVATALAAQALARLDPRSPAVGVRGPDGRWSVKVQHFCPCGGSVEWVHRAQHQELHCTRCDAEYVAAGSGRLYPVEATPLGVCRCPGCVRKQPLVRRPQSEALYCPVSGQIHVRPFDHPAQLRLLAELPLGACSCCAEPQPLIRVDDEVRCYRTRELYRATRHGFTLAGTDPHEPAEHVAAINDALIGGSIGVGQSGLATAAQLDRDDHDD